MKRVMAARGIRLVSRKLRSSCWVKAAIRPLTVINLLDGLASAGGMDSPLSILSLSAAAIAGAAVTFPKLQARLALSRAKHRSLTGHSKMSKMVARLVPHYEFDIDDFFRSDGAPADIATQRQDGFFRLAGLYQDRYAKGRQMTAEAAEHISDLQFTETYRVPFQYSRLVREHLSASAFVQSSSGVTVTDVDGNVSYDLTGSYGVNIFGNDFYKECIAEAGKARACARPGARPLSPRHHRQRQAALRDFRPRRGLVPHVRHRGRDAGGAAGALPHQTHASGSLCRRLSRLVGRRAARRRQSGVAARDLYAGRHVGADAACAEDAPRHRLRAGQSAAGAASERQRARRFRAGRQLALRAISIARPTANG